MVESKEKTRSGIEFVLCSTFKEEINNYVLNSMKVLKNTDNETVIFTYSANEIIDEIKKEVMTKMKNYVEKISSPEFYIDNNITLFHEWVNETTEYKSSERDFSIFININPLIKFVTYDKDGVGKILKEYETNIYLSVAGTITKVILNDEESIMIYLKKILIDEKDFKFQTYYSLIKYLFDKIDDPDKKLNNIAEMLYKNLIN